MTEPLKTIPLQDPILKHVRMDFPTLRQDMTVGEALAAIRQQGVGEKIVYFYALNERDELAGVVPTRRLLTAPLDKVVSDIMIHNIISVPHTATVLQTCDLFIKHRFLAMPVTDDDRHIRGIVDINLFTDEVLDMAERRATDAVFESVGVRMQELKDASPIKAFRYRIPWLLATIISGTLCALLTSVFEATLAQSIVLAFFLTLVLGLGESVSMQSMTVTIQSLRTTSPTWLWFNRAARREALVAAMLGAACGLIVGIIVLIWRGDPWPALVIGTGIFCSITAACVLGLSVPAILHALKLDPKIAAGPITLALADLCTLTFYFTIATMIL
ncbi:MAG: magnesium transporter [Phycisphaeraceae bacterium]